MNLKNVWLLVAVRWVHLFYTVWLHYLAPTSIDLGFSSHTWETNYNI